MSHTQSQHRLTFATEVCYSCTRQFYRSNDSFRKLEASASLENHFQCPFAMVLHFRNGWHLTLPTLRNKEWSHLQNMYTVYINISHFHLLPRIVSRSLANYTNKKIKPCKFSSMYFMCLSNFYVCLCVYVHMCVCEEEP